MGGAHAEPHHHVDAGHGHQPLDRGALQGIAGQFALDHAQVLAQAVILAQVPLHRIALVRGQILRQEPGATPVAKQVGMRALRQQVRVQDGLRDRLEPDPLVNNLVAPCDLSGRKLLA